MKINRVIWRHQDTLYSYMDGLKTFPWDPVSASIWCAEKAAMCASGDADTNPIKNNLDRSRTPFFATLNRGSYLSKLRDDLGFFTVVCDDGAEPIPGIRRVDIPASILTRFTNTANTGSEIDIDFARRFVDVAIAAGAARILVVHDEWYSKVDQALSEYRGVILIDSDVFLEYVDHSVFKMIDDGETEITFPLSYRLGDLSSLVIAVDTVPFGNLSQDPNYTPECPDFALVDHRAHFEKGYQVAIKDQTDDETILQVVYNVSPKAAMGSHIGAPLLGVRGSYKRKTPDA